MVFHRFAPASLFRAAVSPLRSAVPARGTLFFLLSLPVPGFGRPFRSRRGDTDPRPSLFQLRETLSDAGARLAACLPGASKPGVVQYARTRTRRAAYEDVEHWEFIIHFLTRKAFRALSLSLSLSPSSSFFPFFFPSFLFFFLSPFFFPPLSLPFAERTVEERRSTLLLKRTTTHERSSAFFFRRTLGPRTREFILERSDKTDQICMKF